MLSEAYVSHSVHKGDLPLKGGGSVSRVGVCLRGVCLRGDLPPGASAQPSSLVLTSSGDHYSAQFASLWNAFLFIHFSSPCKKLISFSF